MNQISNIKAVKMFVLKNMDNRFINSDIIISKTKEAYYLNLGRLDLAKLRLVFLEKFNYLIEFSKNKERDYKLFENINYYFDFIDYNLVVYTENEYDILFEIIKGTYILMKNSIKLKDIYYFYECYTSLRRKINKFKLTKKNYKERIIY